MPICGALVYTSIVFLISQKMKLTTIIVSSGRFHASHGDLSRFECVHSIYYVSNILHDDTLWFVQDAERADTRRNFSRKGCHTLGRINFFSFYALSILFSSMLILFHFVGLQN